MKLKKQPVFLVLPEHHMVFNKMLGKDPSPSALQPPVLDNLKTNKQTKKKTSNDYIFPRERDSLLADELSVPGGLGTEHSPGTLRNEAGLD